MGPEVGTYRAGKLDNAKGEELFVVWRTPLLMAREEDRCWGQLRRGLPCAETLSPSLKAVLMNCPEF